MLLVQLMISLILGPILNPRYPLFGAVIAFIAHNLAIDTPASAQMTESPINTNTKSGGMRVEGRVTCPPKSTPTKRRSAAMM